MTPAISANTSASEAHALVEPITAVPLSTPGAFQFGAGFRADSPLPLEPDPREVAAFCDAPPDCSSCWKTELSADVDATSGPPTLPTATAAAAIVAKARRRDDRSRRERMKLKASQSQRREI